jgi:hypothetical protein
MFEDRKQFIDRANLFIDFGPAAAFMLEIGAQMNIVQDPQMREQLSSLRYLRNTQGHDFVARHTGDIQIYINNAALLHLDET